MQKSIQVLLLSFFIIFTPMVGHAGEDDIGSIRQLANQIFRSAQDMVEHGTEGHIGEIVIYGNKVLKRAKTLLSEVKKSSHKKLTQKKEVLLRSIESTLEKAKEAVSLGETRDDILSLKAAKRTAFHARKTRQQLQMIR